MTESDSKVDRRFGDGATVPSATVGMVGRGVELVQLRALVAEVAAGQGQSVWIQGHILNKLKCRSRVDIARHAIGRR